MLHIALEPVGCCRQVCIAICDARVGHSLALNACTQFHTIQIFLLSDISSAWLKILAGPLAVFDIAGATRN